MNFVTARGGRLWLDGAPFRFMGTNCYFLQEEGARELLGWEGYAGRVDEALRKAAALGLSVVRAWAFNDDPENPAAIQATPLEYNAAGLRGVDLALAMAQKHGLRLILSLGNYWDDYGGVAQYLRWHGYDPTERWRFFTDEAVLGHYGDHIEALLRRKNSLTGVTWGEDPAVLAWELLNEPRGAGLNDEGETMVAWVEAIASRLRRVAPSHLIATGEEGAGLDDVDGEHLVASPRAGAAMDFRRNTAAVDLASVHLYPESWRWPPGSFADAGAEWIRSRARAAAEIGRPLFLGEFGLRNDGLPLIERRRIYEQWIATAQSDAHVTGAASWSFSTDDRPDEWDAFTWYWRDRTPVDAEENRYADLHRDWAQRFAEIADGGEA